MTRQGNFCLRGLWGQLSRFGGWRRIAICLLRKLIVSRKRSSLATLKVNVEPLRGMPPIRTRNFQLSARRRPPWGDRAAHSTIRRSETRQRAPLRAASLRAPAQRRVSPRARQRAQPQVRLRVPPRTPRRTVRSTNSRAKSRRSKRRRVWRTGGTALRGFRKIDGRRM